MGFLNQLAERRSWSLASPPETEWDPLVPSLTNANGTPTINQATALGLDTVWACVTLLARSIGQMPLIVYKGEGRERERAKGSWQWRLLHEQPNPSWQPDAFIEDIVALENLWGNWYAEKVKAFSRGRSIVGELWRIPPSKVQVSTNRAGQKFFEVSDGPTLTMDDVLHIPGFGYDGRKGLSPIAVHRFGLGNVASRRSVAGDFYGNGSGQPAGVLESDKPLSPEAAKKLKANWDSAHSGKKRGGTAVLEDGVTWRQLSMPMVEQQYVEQERFSVNQVCRIFQVPPEKVGGDRSSSMTYSNVESANLDFVIFSLQHWMVRIEQGFKRDPDLFPPGLGLYPEFLAEGLLRSDPLGRAEFYTKMAALRALSVEEIRERENLGPVREGDTFAPVPGAAVSDSEPHDPSLNGKVDPELIPVTA